MRCDVGTLYLSRDRYIVKIFEQVALGANFKSLIWMDDDNDIGSCSTVGLLRGSPPRFTRESVVIFKRSKTWHDGNGSNWAGRRRPSSGAKRFIAHGSRYNIPSGDVSGLAVAKRVLIHSPVPVCHSLNGEVVFYVFAHC